MLPPVTALPSADGVPAAGVPGGILTHPPVSTNPTICSLGNPLFDVTPVVNESVTCWPLPETISAVGLIRDPSAAIALQAPRLAVGAPGATPAARSTAWS